MPAAVEGESLFVWTDTGFDETLGDCNGDDFADAADAALLESVIAGEDGGPRDLDGVGDGVVTVGVGATWSYFDLDSDGAIDGADVAIVNPPAPCLADWDASGVREVPDIFAFLSAWFAQDLRADVDGSGALAVPDIFFFLSAWFAGCP